MPSFFVHLASIVSAAAILSGVSLLGGASVVESEIAADLTATAADVPVSRLGGSTRFATAVTIANHHASGADRVYLTTGEDYPDALVAGATAGGYGAPVLLSGSATLPAETEAALGRLSPSKVVVVGGTTVISHGVAEEAAAAANASLRRVAGRNRVETALALAEEAATAPHTPVAYLATGEGFADALAASAAAAADGAPLLLTAGDTLLPAVGEAFESLDPDDVKVIGGRNSIPDGIIEELDSRIRGDVHRVAGSDRFATAVAVANHRFDDPQKVYLATGLDFPDALAGGAAAGASDAPLLLSGRDALPTTVAAELERLEAPTLVALGGRAALTDSVLAQAARMLGRLGAGPLPDHGEGGGNDADRPDEPIDGADRMLSGDELVEGFTVPAGEVWAFDPDTTTTVETTGNVVVEGTLVMRPSSADVVHTLRFVGVDETAMVGGGMEVVDSDVGLWVVEDGRLDLQGTERAGWNRTGDDASWRDGDEVRRAPIERGVTEEFPAFTPGSGVPSVTAPDGSQHRAEVFNLTRNVRIHGGGRNPGGEVLADDGRAHVIFLGCQQPQTIKHAELRWLGPRGPHSRDDADGLTGRYGLHFHHCGDGSRGSVVEGVVARDLGNSAYVPHASHGVTFRDTISFDTYESAYWWDPGDETHDVVYDRAAALLTRDYPSYRGYSLDGFTLGEGINMTVRDSVVAGHQGKSVNSGAFHWPGKAAGDRSKNNTWTFDGNVAHNNKHNGLSVWQNDANDHIITDYVGYRNGKAGINHGSYRNRYHYRDSLVFDNEFGIIQHALSSDEQIVFSNLDVGDVYIDSHSLASDNPVIYDNVRVRGTVTVDEGTAQAGLIEFRYDCAHSDIKLGTDDFDLVTPLSDIRIIDDCTEDTTTVHSADG